VEKKRKGKIREYTLGKKQALSAIEEIIRK